MLGHRDGSCCPVDRRAALDRDGNLPGNQIFPEAEIADGRDDLERQDVPLHHVGIKLDGSWRVSGGTRNLSDNRDDAGQQQSADHLPFTGLMHCDEHPGAASCYASAARLMQPTQGFLYWLRRSNGQLVHA